jgi:hypothetical protein
MATEIMERSDPETVATPEPEVVEAAETTQPEVPEETKDAEQPEETPAVDEPEYEVEGQRYKASQLKEWKEAADNKDKWQKANTLKAQEIASKRKELEQAEAIYNLVRSDPAKLQKLLAPEPERDYDAELNTLYQQAPDPLDRENYLRWEFQKDQLLSAKSAERGYKHALAQESQRATKEHNDALVNRAYEKYKGKMSDEEFVKATEWGVARLAPKDGRMPEEFYDIAYSVLYGGRDLEQAKLSAAKSVGDSIRRAKPASGETGKLPKQETKSPGDEEDEAFAARIRDRFGSAR